MRYECKHKHVSDAAFSGGFPKFALEYIILEKIIAQFTMAKTAPPKKKGSQLIYDPLQFEILMPSQATSVHSRAAKRASSPSIDTDKSLKNVKPPAESVNYRPSILAIHHGAGVTKKPKSGRKVVLSAKAKRRQEKDLDRAKAVTDKKEKKIEKSKGRARTVQKRSKTWEELNKTMAAKRSREEAFEKENWVSEEDVAEEVQDDVEVNDASLVTVAASTPLPEPAEYEYEIL
jgi:hypothetical protein